MDFTAEKVAGVLGRWGIRFARFRPDLEAAGSPDRTLARTVIEDDRGRLFRLEKIGFLNAGRKNEIARTQAFLGGSLPEIHPPLALDDGAYLAETGDDSWQTTPFIEGVPLVRPDYAGEGWRGPRLADFLVRLKSASAKMPEEMRGSIFSIGHFVQDLGEKIRERHPEWEPRLSPAFALLEDRWIPREEALPAGFGHGDFHALNIIWSRTGVRGVVDWEFCGMKPEMYDAALLVGTLGMEHPKFLNGDFTHELLEALRESAAYAPESREAFFELVLAIRFAWLSDWIRRGDAEMVELEIVYLGLLVENRDFFVRNWRLRS